MGFPAATPVPARLSGDGGGGSVISGISVIGPGVGVANAVDDRVGERETYTMQARTTISTNPMIHVFSMSV